MRAAKVDLKIGGDRGDIQHTAAAATHSRPMEYSPSGEVRCAEKFLAKTVYKGKNIGTGLLS